jgi:hypothetical protein
MQRTQKKQQQENEQEGTELLDYLETWAKRIDIDLGECAKSVAPIENPTFHLLTAETINNRNYILPPRDDYGRVHSPFTRLWRPLRQHLSYQGKRLEETDVSNSQIVYFVKLLIQTRLQQGKELTPDEVRFKELVEQGQIYDYLFTLAKAECPEYLQNKQTRIKQRDKWNKQFYIYVCTTARSKTAKEWKQARAAYLRRNPIKCTQVEHTPVTRDDFKRVVFADIFYGPKETSSSLTGLFAEQFPTVAAFIQEQKRANYRELARNMQREEAHLMLDVVCTRLKDYHPEIPVITIHDSIMTTPEHIETAKRIIKEEFARIGLKPTLH